MGCFHSTPSVHGDTATNNNATDLSEFYEEACRLDPALSSFDAALRQRTRRVVSAIAADAESLRSLSFKSLQEAADGLADVGRGASDAILELKADIASDPDLLFFVREHFRNAVEILKFFAALRDCLRRARQIESIASAAVESIEREDFVDALDKLAEFRAAGDPFTKGFVEEFRTVCQQQRKLLQALRTKKGELDRKLSSAKTWRKVWGVLFAVAFAAALICSVVLAAVSAPPAAAAAAAAASAAAAPLGEWLGSLWNAYEKTIKDQRVAVAKLKDGASFAIHELDSIRIQVEMLQVHLGALVRNAEFTILEEEEEEAVRMAVGEIRRKLGAFTNSVQKLEKEVDRCSEDLRIVTEAILKSVTDGEEDD